MASSLKFLDNRRVNDPLPIDDALPNLIDALRRKRRAVLQAPPGAGKTTRVPPAILSSKLGTGRILMLEPRRLAARAAAERMADSLGETVGQTVGYRMRGETGVSDTTRIEVVTDGIFTRMIQNDPTLEGISALIFDEFHERSLNADLGLALAWEARCALRQDLLLVVMSATLDARPVADLLNDAPVVTSEGRAFPVEIRWISHPLRRSELLETAAASIRDALDETDGGILVFLPGEREIHRLAALLGRLVEDVPVHPLYGTLPFAKQRAAVAPAPDGRKIVIATSIAETALTIEDIRVVIDCGLSRRSRYDPGRGMSRLVTERVTRAEADQRTGRAGRVRPGICHRLWTKGEEGGLKPFPSPEIAATDLCGLVLELALWGAVTPEGFTFLTRPPDGAWNAAQASLRRLGALDEAGHITDHGRTIAGLPLHPRLAHMLSVAGAPAANLAAILNDRDPLRDSGVDLRTRIDALAQPDRHPIARRSLERIDTESRRLRRMTKGAGQSLSLPQQAALAYPDRIGLRRKGDAARWILSGGTGAVMDQADPLVNSRLIVVTDIDGAGREARIRQAIAISEAELRMVHGERIHWIDVCEWSRRERRVIRRRHERFEALILDDRHWDNAPSDAQAKAMLDGVRHLGLPWSAQARRLQVRAERVRAHGAELPDLSERGLMGSLEDWLLPWLAGIQSAAQLREFDLTQALRTWLGHRNQRLLDGLAPEFFETPAGRQRPIDYADGTPTIAVRLQEMFGVTRHPTVGPDHTPLRLKLLSPAERPLAVTTDLPGFWADAYREVRKDMRGRYPKHPWPENPARAESTLRPKPKPKRS